MPNNGKIYAARKTERVFHSCAKSGNSTGVSRYSGLEHCTRFFYVYWISAPSCRLDFLFQLRSCCHSKHTNMYIYPLLKKYNKRSRGRLKLSLTSNVWVILRKILVTIRLLLSVDLSDRISSAFENILMRHYQFNLFFGLHSSGFLWTQFG